MKTRTRRRFARAGRRGRGGRGSGSVFAVVSSWRGLVGGGFADEGVEVRLGNVAATDIEEIVLEIAFGALVADAEGPGPNAVATQLLREPQVSDLFAITQLGPGPAGKGV